MKDKILKYSYVSEETLSMNFMHERISYDKEKKLLETQGVLKTWVQS